jgi:vancomycin resistance protein YoaR
MAESSAVENPSPTRNAPVSPSVAPRSNRVWIKRLGIGAAILLVLVSGSAYGAYSSWVKSPTLAPGLIVQGEPVGGLTKAQAKERLQKRFGRLFLDVQTPSRDFRMSLQELGGQPKIDAVVHKAYQFGRDGSLVTNVLSVWKARSTRQRLSLPIAWDKTQMRQKMWMVANQYNQPAKDARLRIGERGVEVVPHEEGLKLNVGATLQKQYFAGKKTLTASTESAMPRLTAADLEGRDVKMGVYTTRFNNGLWGRTRNIYVAAGEIDGKVLMTGETFSFNKSTGERTWEKGYRMAHIFERKPGKTESEVVDGLAGGVCQVSSTLYNAVRRTNEKAGRGLKIVQRESHSLPVTYVPTGYDATVAWPYKDFRFRNTYPHPIYLRAVVDGSRLNVSVWGRVSGATASPVSEETATDEETSAAKVRTASVN